MSEKMTKQEQFELAKELRASGLTLARVGEIVGAMAGRKPYASASISGWVRAENYKDYCKKIRESMKKYNQKKEPVVAVQEPKTSSDTLIKNKIVQIIDLAEEITQLRKQA